ncbi:MAG: rhodanese-like domain-containing protein [Dermatophilaceae bacterium]
MSKGVMQMIMDAKSRVGSATAAETAERLRAGSAVVVDVRQSTEWDHGHIDGSVPAPRGLLEFFADPASPRHVEALDPDRPMIVVCHSGARAALAAATLQDMGFGDVAILDGGLTAWLDAGLPVTEHEYAGI